MKKKYIKGLTKEQILQVERESISRVLLNSKERQPPLQPQSKPVKTLMLWSVVPGIVFPIEV